MWFRNRPVCVHRFNYSLSTCRERKVHSFLYKIFIIRSPYFILPISSFASCFYMVPSQLKFSPLYKAWCLLFSFSGAFAKLRKAATSFVMSVCPYGTTRLPLGGFSLNSIFAYFFRKCVEKIQVPLKSDKSNGYYK